LIKIEQIQKFIPQRFPFLLVDRVKELHPGKSIVALKNVSCNEPFFQGHFPGKMIMPGVLIIEAIAQAGGILLYNSIPDPQRTFVVLSKIDNAKFRRPVVPGDQLEIEAEILKLKGKYCLLKGRATVEGEVAAEGEMVASLLDLEEMNERT
jgi:3-hydroxyacyl-[acyl-carrier-protein] dehydratase/UDP-3-O-[3-hydroxymyristoyl] N-acetylglucosamine deacetylase/3-hydroxyacyl-[acyl-carrier-protein] dehydratase